MATDRNWASYNVHHHVEEPVGMGMLATYLNQYLFVATGDRVKYMAPGVLATKFLRFRCTHCADNWNVGEELFTANGQVAIPTELTDWVKKHEHVCTFFHGDHLSGSRCLTCGWAGDKHAAVQGYSFAPGFLRYEDVAQANLVRIAQIVEAGKPKVVLASPAALPRVRTLREVTGRKFR